MHYRRHQFNFAVSLRPLFCQSGLISFAPGSLLVTLLLALAILANISPALAQDKISATASGTASGTEDIAPAPEDSKPALASLTVRLSVPQMNKATDLFTVYPYTVKPPRVVQMITPLPETDEALKNSLFNSGYVSRLSMNKPYPAQGWRWHYAYSSALKRSGGYEPSTLIGLYGWQKDMIKYIKPECERINKIEELRTENYQKMLQSYEDNHKDEEMEALRNGLEPTPLKFHLAKKGKAIEGTVNLKPGEWWITGQHRVPGLTYFYMYNLKLSAGEHKEVLLNDTNAILIQGGW